ncbi:MAG TPA: hypothetical protein VD906_14345, partial [Caulobacteraceae bacterium]|nr:hypothetical protein [Caulobacteraceae bacterium]
MRPGRPILPLLLALVFAAGCTQTPRIAASDAGSASDESLRLTALTDLDQRVARVAWRLSEAN